VKARWVLVALGLVGQLVVPRQGHAERPPEPAPAEQPPEQCEQPPEVCGKQAFEAGIEAYQRGDYPVALKWFRRAQALKPHPVILFNVALAETKTGLLLEATQHFDQVFNDPNTPADKLDAARSERERAAALLASVTVDRQDARLVVDGIAATGSPPLVRVNPGAHHVRVLVAERVVVDRNVELQSGQRLELSLALGASEESEPAPAPAPPPAPPPPAAADRPSGLSPTWVLMGAGLTAVLGGLSVWSGLDASRAYDEFEDEAPSLSRDEARERVDQGQSKDLRTQALLGATAAVALATGAIALFAVQWGQPPGADSAALHVSPAGVVISARF
jgi:hypothetical protein